MKKIFALFLMFLLFSACKDSDSSSQEKDVNSLETSKNTNDQSNRMDVSNIIGEWEGVTSSSPGSPPLFTLDIKYAEKGVVDAQYWIQYLGDQDPTKHNITGTYNEVGDTINIVFDYSHKADQNNFKFRGSIIDKRTVMFCIYESEYDYIYWDFEIWKKEKKETFEDVLLKELNTENDNFNYSGPPPIFGLEESLWKSETGRQFEIILYNDDFYLFNIEANQKYMIEKVTDNSFVYSDFSGNEYLINLLSTDEATVEGNGKKFVWKRLN